jgi:hypothetical protein
MQDFQKVKDALEKAKQGIREVNKANKNPNWFTGGRDGAMRHKHHWEREKDNAIEEALVELNTFMESNGWQDIETLKPSDGYVNFYVDGEVEQGYKEGSNCYIINNGDYNYGGYGSDYKCEDGGVYSLPTHWQPLPSIKAIKV